jgi:hypothetical protein
MVVAGRDSVGDVGGSGVELTAVATIRAMKAAVHTRYGPAPAETSSALVRTVYGASRLDSLEVLAHLVIAAA